MEMQIGKYTFVISVPLGEQGFEEGAEDGFGELKKYFERWNRKGLEVEIEDGLMVDYPLFTPFFMFEIEPLKYQLVFMDKGGRYPWIPGCDKEYKKQIEFRKTKVILLVTEDVGKVEDYQNKGIFQPFFYFQVANNFAFAPIQFIGVSRLQSWRGPKYHIGLGEICPPNFYGVFGQYPSNASDFNISRFYHYIQGCYGFRRMKVVCKDNLYPKQWELCGYPDYKPLTDTFADWRKNSPEIGKKYPKYSLMEDDERPQEVNDKIENAYMCIMGSLYYLFDVEGHWYVFVELLDYPEKFMLLSVRKLKDNPQSMDDVVLDLSKSNMSMFEIWEQRFKAERNKKFILEPFFSDSKKDKKCIVKRKSGQPNDFNNVKVIFWQ